MSIYAFFPLVAVILYIPLLITTIGSRPLQRRHELFILFLVSAITWALTDVFLRGNLFPPLNDILLKVIIITYAWTAVQYHCFVSSFYAPGQGRWLPFAYGSLAAIVVVVLLGYLPKGVTVQGDMLYLDYGRGIVFLLAPLLVLLIRNVYVLWKRLKILDNAVLYNQIVSLLLTLGVLTVFSFSAILPWGRELAVVHFGSIINAFILSYATIRHQLLDIRIVLRRSLAWVGLAIIGLASYALLLVILHNVFGFNLDMRAALITALAASLVAGFLYNLRAYLFITMGKAFHGQSYDYRQRLSDFASRIQNVFSLKEQGGELLSLVTKAVGCRRACLLFPEVRSGDFTAQLLEPKGKDNPLLSLRLSAQNPIARYLEREQRLLTRETVSILPEFRGLWEKEKTEVSEVELFMPLISRDKLTGILVLAKKHSGRYSLEDFHLLEDVTKRAATSMEKEYLRERLREREEELSLINRSSAILTSSLDLQEIYGGFIEELRKVVDVTWAAIVLCEEDSLCFRALFSIASTSHKVGERLPIGGTPVEWLRDHRKTIIEPDLEQESRFPADKGRLIPQGMRSAVYLPLVAGDRVIGSLIVASTHPSAYSQRHIMLLEQLATQIAMPVENSRLYAKAEEKARVDELTGLLNRRSLDEVLVSEISRHSRYGGAFSIIIGDLDTFKTFNDNYGHLAGDRLLRQIGGIMRKAIRGSDQAFRYGGDEFAILLPQTNVDAAYDVAERVRKQIGNEVGNGKSLISVSFGLAMWPVDGIAVNELVAAADAALYCAKRNGGNQSYRASAVLLPADETVTGFGDNNDSGTLSTIYALAAAVDARDHYTRNHSKRVSEYAAMLAKALCLAPLETSRLETCALLHDIGKLGVAIEILSKPDKLTDEEWEMVKNHPQLGATIASHARQLAPSIAGILHHHEKYDGSGYPKGLKGVEIPLEARILAIADAFAAMTDDRPYSKALSFEDALAEIKRGAGTQFDPHLVEVFMATVKGGTSLSQKV